MAGGYYVFEADDLDEAGRLARQIPAAQYGAVEVWPMLYWNAPEQPTAGADWLALLLEPAESLPSRAHPSGRRVPGSMPNSTPPPAGTFSVGRRCIRRRRPRRCRCATVTCC